MQPANNLKRLIKKLQVHKERTPEEKVKLWDPSSSRWSNPGKSILRQRTTLDLSRRTRTWPTTRGRPRSTNSQKLTFLIRARKLGMPVRITERKIAWNRHKKDSARFPKLTNSLLPSNNPRSLHQNLLTNFLHLMSLPVSKLVSRTDSKLFLTHTRRFGRKTLSVTTSKKLTSHKLVAIHRRDLDLEVIAWAQQRPYLRDKPKVSSQRKTWASSQ